jgi:hypothetical protein
MDGMVNGMLASPLALVGRAMIVAAGTVSAVSDEVSSTE